MENEYLKRRKIPEKAQDFFQLKEFSERGIVEIPHINIDGTILFKVTNNFNNELTEQKKYDFPRTEELPEGHLWFFGLNIFSAASYSEIVITEGQYNSMSLCLCNIPSLGVPGQWLTFTEKLLKVIPKCVKKITLLYDEYECALKRAAELEKFFRESAEIYIAVYPDKKDEDANDYLVQGREAELINIVNMAKPYFKGSIIENVTIDEVREAVQKYFPDYWLDTICCIDVVTSMVFKDFSSPIALIMVGPPSSGKTTILDFFISGKDRLSGYVYRCDNFTPKAWLSHIASLSKDKLKEIHLLPRIEDKTMVTKDLACLFSKNYEDLEEDIGVVTVVLDGKGLSTDSGSKGKVEYTGKDGHVYFCWLGATTPLTDRVWNVIGLKGNRFLFLNIKDREADDETIAENIYGEITYPEKVSICSQIISRYIKYFYWKNRQYSIKWDRKKDRVSLVALKIIKLSNLVAKLRAPVYYFIDDYGRERRTQFIKDKTEIPLRLAEQLSTMARSNAINHGRYELNEDDLKLVRYIALSSVPIEKKLTLETLISSELKISGRPAVRTRELVEKLNISKYKAKELIMLFGILEICDVIEPEGRQDAQGRRYAVGEYTMVLKEEYLWLTEPESDEN
jgi:hypothetical protein